MRIEDGFQQTPFEEGHPYTSDPVLPSLLKRLFPPGEFREVEAELLRFGETIAHDIRPLTSLVGPPTLTQYNQWGERVDVLQTSEGWRALKAFSQKEGIPGIFYERKYGEFSRPFGFAKVLLLHGDGHAIFCPISMTDGTARVIELLGSQEMKARVLTRLVSRDPSRAFTSGQWMTERPGGSDVSRTETVATPRQVSAAPPTDTSTLQLGTAYTINGFKWFSSATDSDVSVALARTGTPQDGSRGLGLFLIPLRWPLFPPATTPRPTPTSNQVYVHRLKNKMGTHALPTAELSLEGSTGFLIGRPNEGVKNISPVLNITRVWSAMSSVGALRKCLQIATSYAKVRQVYNPDGTAILLQDVPLHVGELASISLTYRALTHLTFGVARLLGRLECSVASADDGKIVRLLTPTVKAFCAQLASGAMEEAMTTLGGAGYMEENGFGRLIRDALVERIWEGTTTVLALDVVRALKRDPSTMVAFVNWARSILASCPADVSTLRVPVSILSSATNVFATCYQSPMPPLIPRPALMLLGHITSSCYLLEHAVWSIQQKELTADVDVEVFTRWVQEGGLVPAVEDVKRVKGVTAAEAESAYKARIIGNSAVVFGTSSAPLKTKI